MGVWQQKTFDRTISILEREQRAGTHYTIRQEQSQEKEEPEQTPGHSQSHPGPVPASASRHPTGSVSSRDHREQDDADANSPLLERRQTGTGAQFSAMMRAGTENVELEAGTATQVSHATKALPTDMNRKQRETG